MFLITFTNKIFNINLIYLLKNSQKAISKNIDFLLYLQSKFY